MLCYVMYAKVYSCMCIYKSFPASDVSQIDRPSSSHRKIFRGLQVAMQTREIFRDEAAMKWWYPHGDELGHGGRMGISPGE